MFADDTKCYNTIYSREVFSHLQSDLTIVSLNKLSLQPNKYENLRIFN